MRTTDGRRLDSLLALWLLVLAGLLPGSACNRTDANVLLPQRAPSGPRSVRSSAGRTVGTHSARAPRSGDIPRPQVAPSSSGGARRQPSALSPALARPAAQRIVAIGDLHGDLAATRKALRLAGATDASDGWVGGELVLVQTGDVLDRGDDDRLILDLLERLRGEAEQAGGAVLALSGNHEVMNVQQNFSYVTSGGFAAFASEGGRQNAFRPGGTYAAILAEYPIVMKVGDTVFVHGGVLPKHVVYGLDRMNQEVRSWMLGELAWPPAIIVDGDGLLWTRVYSVPAGPADCEQLEEALTMLDAKRMVVGHTPQLTGITSACDERVWRIDVGMSQFYGGPIQILEIRGDAVSVHKESADED